jgi:PAS domain S-box-containing protein
MERKQSSGKNLKATKLLLSQIIDFLPDPTFAIDLRGKVIVWNRAMEELTQIRAQDMIGKADYEYALPFYDERHPILIDLVLHPDPDFDTKYTSIQKKGDSLFAETVALSTKRFLWGKASPIHDNNGQIIGAIESIRDITELRRAEEALLQSEKKYHDIFLNVSDLLMIHDLKGNFIETNLASKKSTGYSKADLKDMNLKDILPERYKTQFKDYINRVLENGSDEGLMTIVAKTGDERILEYRNSLRLDPEGRPTGVRGSARDITSRIKAAKRLKKEHDFITSIIQTSPAFYDAIDPDGRTIFMNQAMLNALGYTLSDVVDKDYVKQIIQAEDRRAFKDAMDTMVSSRKPVVHENRVLAKDGKTLLVQWQGKAMYHENGEIEFIFGIGIDITEHKRSEQALKESEERYRILAENARDVIWILDLDLKYVYMSPSIKRLRGYSAEEVMKQSLDQVLTPESYRRAMEVFHKELGIERMGQIHGPDWSRTIEIEMFCKDGSTVWAEVIINLLYDKEGTLTSFMGITRDITKRKRIEEELRESEEKFRLLFEKSGDGSLILDEGRFIDCNEAAIKIAGCTDKSQLMNYRPAEISPPFQPDGLLSAEKAEKMMDLAIKKGFHQFEWVHKRFDGTEVYLDVMLTAIPMKGRRLLYTTWRDISERKSVDEALRASEEKFSKAFHTSPTLMAINTFEEGRYIDVNEVFLSILGYTKEEVIGRTPDEIGIFPDTSYLTTTRKILEEQGKLNNYELQVRTKDGHFRNGLFSGDVIRLQDKKYWLTVMTDITEKRQAEEALKQSEERFRRMAEVSPEIFWMVTPDWERVIYVSPALERIIGMPVDEVYRDPRAWLNLVHPEDSNYVSSTIGFGQEHAADGEYDFRIIRKDGGMRWVRNRRYTIHDAQGNLMYYTGIAEDITERKQAEEDRKVYEARLMRSQKLEAIGTLAGGIAHDFNNILSAIIGYSELALDDLPKDNSASMNIEEVLKAGERAKELVKQILTFSRQRETERRPVKIDLIIKEALKLLRSSIPSSISITERIDPSSGPVFADPTQIHQVIMNLCTNAYHAMLPNGGNLTVSLEQLYLDTGFISRHPPLHEGTHLRLTVSDTGCGMDQETLKRIFDPFFTTKEKTKGTGLGLATVHGIVTDLGGAIFVTSTIGKGSSFELYLPTFEEESDELENFIETPPQGGGESILLVDDEEAILNFSKTMLEQLGYKVKGISSSVEALKIFRSSPDKLDLVLTDQTMPGMTGSTLATEILTIRPDMPIILMTGYSETITPEEVIAQGIKEYIEKPFTKNIIAAAIHRSLKG